jgi:hypothetical protein
MHKLLMCDGLRVTGITGTPVVDTAQNVLYVAANSKPTTGPISGGQSSKWTLYSLDLTTGQNKYNPVVIQVPPNGRGQPLPFFPVLIVMHDPV